MPMSMMCCSKRGCCRSIATSNAISSGASKAGNQKGRINEAIFRNDFNAGPNSSKGYHFLDKSLLDEDRPLRFREGDGIGIMGNMGVMVINERYTYRFNRHI